MSKSFFSGWYICYGAGIWEAHRYGVRMRARSYEQIRNMILTRDRTFDNNYGRQ